MLDSFYRWLTVTYSIEKWKKYYAEKDRVLNYKIADDVAIEFENITKTVNSQVLINNFNFKFLKDRVYGIIGASGSGKSILSDHFNGLSKSDSGNIYIFNDEKIPFYSKKIDNYKEIRRQVGMVLQFPEYQLFKETVLEDVCYGLKMLGIDEEDIIPRATNKLIELGINEELFNRNPFMLSGGQKRKVALAGILAINPEIIVFDEPTIGLDPSSEDNIIYIIKELKKAKKTVIIISHNSDLILSLVDELLVIEKGELIDWGEPYFIYRKTWLNIGRPKIIKFIEKLVLANPKFNNIFQYKPKNIIELSDAIKNIHL